jgi:hypothetical protein
VDSGHKSFLAHRPPNAHLVNDPTWWPLRDRTTAFALNFAPTRPSGEIRHSACRCRRPFRPASRRLGQIDSTIDEAAKRGRTVTALTAIEGQRKGREALSAQRQREASTLADLKAKHAALGAKSHQIETEAAPIRYVAELVGTNTDSERAIRC